MHLFFNLPLKLSVFAETCSDSRIRVIFTTGGGELQYFIDENTVLSW